MREMADFPPYDPANWFWQVAGRTDYWSSAAGAYVEMLPEGASFTRIASEMELSEVLAHYGLKGPAVIVPERVTSRQFKLQLLAAGLLDQVEAWVGQQDQTVQIAYANSGTFLRTEPMMQTGFAALGFTSGQIDDFYTAAAAL
jgi:hypothetical protein